MSGSASKRPHPSYEEGKVRDKRIKEAQARNERDQRGGLLDLIKRSIRKPAAEDASAKS